MTSSGTEIPFPAIEGIEVGNAEDLDAKTGCTAILCREGAVGAAEVLGLASGTRELDALSPLHIVPKIHGLMLSGGSAFGLDAAGGAMQYLEEQGIGFDTSVARVPIVPSAIIYDLYLGDPSRRPDREMGYLACASAGSGAVMNGSTGAGTGAVIGKLYGLEWAMKGGLGAAAVSLPDGLEIGALAVCNAFGDVRDPRTGNIIAGARDRENPERFADTVLKIKQGAALRGFARENTTLAVIATNGNFSKTDLIKVLKYAQASLAATLSPAFTHVDGDVLFGLATGKTEGDIVKTGVIAAELLSEAIIRGIREADGFGVIMDWQRYRKRATESH